MKVIFIEHIYVQSTYLNLFFFKLFVKALIEDEYNNKNNNCGSLTWQRMNEMPLFTNLTLILIYTYTHMAYVHNAHCHIPKLFTYVYSREVQLNYDYCRLIIYESSSPL